jgi:hypothetical protein
MECKHERLKCTNNVFTCLDCGAVIQPDELEKKPAKKPAKKRESTNSK